MTSFFRFLPILLFSFVVSPLYAASFDCKKATSETEIAVCFDLGYQAFEKEEFQEAFDYWKPLADAGDARKGVEVGELRVAEDQISVDVRAVEERVGFRDHATAAADRIGRGCGGVARRRERRWRRRL